MIKSDPDKLLTCSKHLSENAVQINLMLNELNNDMPILFPSFSGPHRYQGEMETAVAYLNHVASLFNQVSRELIAVVEFIKNEEMG